MKKKKNSSLFAGIMALGIAAAAPLPALAFTFNPPAPVSAGTVDVNLDSGSNQDTSSTPAAADTVDTQVNPAAVSAATIIPTGIRADGVFNTGGYANLVQDAVMSNPGLDPFESENEVLTSRQVALMDRGGNLLLPFRKSYNNFYCYTDGIVSLACQTPYMCMDEELGVKDPQFMAFEEYNYYYDLSGNELFRTECSSPVSEGYGILIDESGAYIMNSLGVKVVKLPDTYAEYRFTGDIIGNGKAWELGMFSNGLAQVTRFGTDTSEDDADAHVAGYMNANGEMVLDFSSFGYVKSGPFEADLTWAGNGGSLGFIDRSGNLVIPYLYEYAYPFTADGLAAVQMNGKWGYIDAANNQIIPFMYDHALGMYNGLAAVGLNGKYGYVDRNNQVIVPLEYDDISTFKNGVGYAVKDGYVYIITR